MKDSDTLSFNQLIDGLGKVYDFEEEKNQIIKGLKIAKVFRNKEGHSVTLWHDYDSGNYQDIENSIVIIYEKIFGEKLNFKVSFAKDEGSEFKIT